jgi:alkylation response protein AidB-like acyl-CoA dehydrogenase
VTVIDSDRVADLAVGEFLDQVRDWLGGNAALREFVADEWGKGSDDVSVFHDLTAAEERALIDEARAWQARKWQAGLGAISWPTELGGAGLSEEHEKAFRQLEARYVTPSPHEAFAVTVHLVAPTIRVLGTQEQRLRFLPLFLGGEDLCCQLFSEPGAGSDLANVSTRAERDGDHWVLNGQKVWSSGAQFAGWGEAICRTDPEAARHRGLTAFLVPMDTPGVDVRPIRQMSGGCSFNEVFLTDVRIPDDLRLGAEGDGWTVALTTLGFERGSSGSAHNTVGGSWPRLADLARHCGRTDEAVIRQHLARCYTDHRLRQFIAWRLAGADLAGAAPGPEGSIGKLLWTESMRRISDVVSQLLGPQLVADDGQWGTYAWAAHVLGATGYRIAGGSDEIQRNIIGERVLGLPRDPR